MMDVNEDKVITLEEFQLVEKMINRSATKSMRGSSSKERQLSHTTLLTHLFGADLSKTVTFDDFFQVHGQSTIRSVRIRVP